MTKIRVVVIDDSSFLRRTLPRLLESDPEIEVVGVAANGVEGIAKIKELRPDVVTLDVIMPVMDGLTALKRIMAEVPTPVVMMSSTTHEGAHETLEALAQGAVDFITKPSGPISLDIANIKATLIEKIKAARGIKPSIASSTDTIGERFRTIVRNIEQGKMTPTPALRERAPGTESAPKPARTAGESRHHWNKRVIAIATSTGGPAALQMVIPSLPANLNAGVIIVQHIAPGFTRPLAERLNSLSQITVREAEDGSPITPGVALLSPADVHMTVERSQGRLVVRLNSEPANAPFRPSANVLFRSMAECCAGKTCAVILTGMSDDGALGIRAVRDGGGYTIAQDKDSSLIYGMPRWAVELGGATISLPLDQIAAEIVRSTLGQPRER